MESKIEKCKIDNVKNVITLTLDNSQQITIPVNTYNDNVNFLNYIDLANRKYCAFVYENNLSGKHNFGVLNSQVVNLDEIPLTLLPPKYILNVFFKLLQCLFQNNPKLLKYFNRDDKYVDIPISSSEISSLINDIMKAFHDIQDSSSMMETDDDDDDAIINIKDVFALIIEYIMKLYSKNQSLLENNENCLRRKANMIGRINNEHIKNLKTDFDQGLSQAGEKIHEIITKRNEEIYFKNSVFKEKIDFIINCIHNDASKCIYVNTAISFKFMMKFILEIFKILFTDILPKSSMLDSLYGILYQAAFLREMNILQYYSNIIHLPLMYRIIHSFYKDESNSNNDNDYEKYLKNEYSGIYRLIKQLHTNTDNNCDKQNDNTQILCEIASKCNIQELKMLDSLYWVLNKKQNCIFEFYIIILIVMYIKAKCANVKSINKISNAKEFIEPIYQLIDLFRYYIIKDIKDKNVAVCTETFNNFNQLYSNDIKRIVKSLVINIQK